jgi:Oxidoreductase molybdopterin binding domain/Mo-co oxidoreductase dimerisation domain
MESSKSKATMRISRRKFVKAAGAAVIIAGMPGAAHFARASTSAPAKFGGPTPNGDFYVTSYGSTPSVDAAAWRFHVKGLVQNPFELDYGQVKALPQINEELTLECISNPPDGTAISNAVWQGFRLKPLLDRAKVDRRAVWVAMRGADGYYTGLPVDELLRPENFMPWKMNGVPLPPAHGFPLRIFIPGKYGMKQPKWITELEFLDHETTGYWEGRGWSNTAWRKVNSGFFSPRVKGGLFSIFDRSAKVTAPVDIWGWALAGPSGIRRVQVSTDDGETWHDADLVRNSSVYVWTVWKYRFAPASPGKFVVRVRATDGKGVVQPPTDPQTGSGMSGQPRMAVEVTSVA